MTATLVGVDELIHSPRHRRYLLRHTFSGAALTPSDLGPALTTNYGTVIVSGGVLSFGVANVGLFVPNIGANIVAQVRVNFGNSAGGDRRVSIQARASAMSGNVVEAVLYRSSDQIALWRRDAGAVTVLASSGALSLADSTDYWLRLVLRGSNLEVLTSTDGTTFTSRITHSEPLYVANTGLGIKIDDNGTQTIIVDDLMVWTP